MKFNITDLNGIRFLECEADGGIIDDESAALDIVALCGENEVDTILISSQNLTSDFFDLKSGTAGRIMLKFSNYTIRVAAVLSTESDKNGHFYEMILETNRGNQFRVFSNYSDAIEWIKKIN
jgi:PadR family transcriptional regulator, regulatory protein AphA